MISEEIYNNNWSIFFTKLLYSFLMLSAETPFLSPLIHCLTYCFEIFNLTETAFTAITLYVLFFFILILPIALVVS